MEGLLLYLDTVTGPLAVYFLFAILPAGLDDLRSARARRLIVFGLFMVSILIIVAAEAFEEDRLRASSWEIIGLLGVKTLAWGVKKQVLKRDLEQA